MENFINKIVEPFESFFDNLLHYLTNILSFALIVVVGFVLGHFVKVLVHKLLGLVRLDVHCERSEFSEMLRKGGIKDPVSLLVAKVVGWLTVLVFFIIALGALQVPQVDELTREFFLYVPNILVALVIVFVGYVLSNFLARAVLIASVNAGIKSSNLIGRLTRISVLALTVSMALEQLEIGRETVVAAFAIVFGGAVLTLALAFGLGARDLAREYLESRLKKPEEAPKEEKADEFEHL